jgi:hypothetical protein
MISQPISPLPVGQTLEIRFPAFTRGSLFTLNAS